MTIARFRGFLGKVNAFHGVRNIFSYTGTTGTFGRKLYCDAATRLLFRRISPARAPASIVPILDQWVQEGNEVNKSQLTDIIKYLRSYRRYSHALQISMWMSEKRYVELNPGDISIRLGLISNVHGIEEAENYFNSIPVHQRSLNVYGALLHCYAREKCVERAENVMHRIRDLGLAGDSLVYSTLLRLYQQTGNYEKMESLIQEMDENHVRFCGYHTYRCVINAYAAKSETSRIDDILKKSESDYVSGRHWSIYTTAALAYMEAGRMDKAVMALRNAEKFITNSETKSLAYEFLITLFAKAGYRDDVLRVWGMYKKKTRVFNKGYMNCIASLLRLDDIESAEQVFEEWKTRELACDIRIPNYLIGYYSRKGLLEKAEATIEEMISRGAKLNQNTWFYMANGYHLEGKSQEAVEAMRESLKVAAVVDISKWTAYRDVLEACLKFLKDEGNIEEAEEFVGLLERKGIASPDMSERLLGYIRGENSNPNLLSESKEQ